MTLEERLKELKGRYIKVGGRRGCGFIFIGCVNETTALELNRIGSYYISRLYTKHSEISHMLKDWSNVTARMQAIEDANYKKAMATYHELIRNEITKRDEYAEKYGKLSRKYKGQLTSIRDTAKTIAERIWTNRNYYKTIEEKKKYYEESIKLLSYQLEHIHKFTDFDIYEDYMSVDDETYGGRILLVDTWLNGKYWTLSECERDVTLKKLIS